MNFENIKPLPVVCRQSSISCALHCERCWFLRYRLGVVLRGGDFSESASLGRIYHRLQQLGPGSESTVRAEIVKKQTELMDKVNRGEDLDGSISREASMMTEMFNKAVVMAEIFWEKYPQPSYFETIGTEVKHSMELCGLTLEGTIDKILLNKQDGGIWIRDHKTTGRSLESVFGGISWSIQGRIYRILVNDYLKKVPNTEVNIKGFILDGIKKPGIKLCKTDEKNAKDWNVPIGEAYLRRVKQWYADSGEENIRSRSIFFAESLVPEELVAALAKMVSLAKLPIAPTFYRRDVTRRECFAYERECVYHDLCEINSAQWDSLFESKYKFSGTENEGTDL